MLQTNCLAHCHTPREVPQLESQSAFSRRGRKLCFARLFAITTQLCVQQMILSAHIWVSALDLRDNLGAFQGWPEKGGTVATSQDGEMCSEMPSQAYLHLWGFPLATSDFDYDNYVCPKRTERRSVIEKGHHSCLVFFRVNLARSFQIFLQ